MTKKFIYTLTLTASLITFSTLANAMDRHHPYWSCIKECDKEERKCGKNCYNAHQSEEEQTTCLEGCNLDRFNCAKNCITEHGNPAHH